jgi:hypothetical protein
MTALTKLELFRERTIVFSPSFITFMGTILLLVVEDRKMFAKLGKVPLGYTPMRFNFKEWSYLFALLLRNVVYNLKYGGQYPEYPGISLTRVAIEKRKMVQARGKYNNLFGGIETLNGTEHAIYVDVEWGRAAFSDARVNIEKLFQERDREVHHRFRYAFFSLYDILSLYADA